jgi:hypothetical protein
MIHRNVNFCSLPMAGEEHQLILASADSAGQIILWNVQKVQPTHNSCRNYSLQSCSNNDLIYCEALLISPNIPKLE